MGSDIANAWNAFRTVNYLLLRSPRWYSRRLRSSCGCPQLRSVFYPGFYSGCLLTGCDPKNRPWSYHNGGNWPVLLWLLAAASSKANRSGIGDKALEIAAKRLPQDEWAEYYDGKSGRLVGKEARKYQTWTIAGFLLAQELMNSPHCLNWISYADD